MKQRLEKELEKEHNEIVLKEILETKASISSFELNAPHTLQGNPLEINNDNDSSSELKREEYLKSRKLREEQEKEFQRLMEEDAKKEETIRRRNNQKVAEKERKKNLSEKLGDGVGLNHPKEQTRIVQFRLLNGEKLERRFNSKSTIQELFDFVDANDENLVRPFQLINPIPPKKIFRSDQEELKGKTLEQLDQRTLLIAENIES
eukprot:TRINITY_DN2268_c0_g1_i2.p1 TRINITY_DN2268_c0_g1~~TRINITY_DN2268_c0_g1_i2.p1  ORF type:complete len:205 (-),score=87.53 TRINITY_DN2268_c0_g1_i2:855-1469(-)